MLIARDEYPDLDPAVCRRALDDYAAKIRAGLDDDADETSRLVALNRFLFEELGYAGNHDDYEDPRNSYMNVVLDRRLGIPLSLAVVQIEVARRLDLQLDGISFPGHFLVRMPLPGGIVVVDPFNKGRPLAASELRERARPYLNDNELDDDQLLEILSPATHRAILVRMLRNLKGLYAKQEDWARLARCCDRLLKLRQGRPESISAPIRQGTGCAHRARSADRRRPAGAVELNRSVVSVERHHLEVVLGNATVRTGPRFGHIFPSRARRNALFRQAIGLAVNKAADHAHPASKGVGQGVGGGRVHGHRALRVTGILHACAETAPNGRQSGRIRP